MTDFHRQEQSDEAKGVDRIVMMMLAQMQLLLVMLMMLMIGQRQWDDQGRTPRMCV